MRLGLLVQRNLKRVRNHIDHGELCRPFQGCGDLSCWIQGRRAARSFLATYSRASGARDSFAPPAHDDGTLVAAESRVASRWWLLEEKYLPRRAKNAEVAHRVESYEATVQNRLKLAKGRRLWFDRREDDKSETQNNQGRWMGSCEATDQTHSNHRPSPCLRPGGL